MRESSSVLILTQTIDPTADYVVAQLNRAGTNVIRADMAEFPQEMSVEAFIDSDLDDWAGELTRAHRSIELGAVGSVWWRRPTWFNFPDTLTREERGFARDEAAMGLGGLLRLQDVFWMNHPESAIGAEFKPVQLKAACRHGLRIPRSLITTSAEAARAFVQENQAVGRRTIYKTLAYADVINPVTGRDEVIYTSVVDPAQLADDQLLRYSPCLFQEQVPKTLELRVTVVGDRVFTAGIDVQTPAGRIDFRSDYDNISYRPYELPDAVACRLIEYVKSFGLSFGAIDLIVDDAGDYVFLEINPNGQWAWLEDALDLPISAAIAESLSCGQRSLLAERA